MQQSDELHFSAEATVRVTKETNIFQDMENDINAVIECKNGADVVLKISTGHEISAMNFLTFLDISREDVEKKFHVDDRIDFLTFQHATISFALSGEPDFYAVYIEGGMNYYKMI